MLNYLGHTLRSTPWPRPLVRWLPGNSRHFGPPRRCGLIRELVPAAGGRVVEIDPARDLPEPKAICHGPMSATGLEGFHPRTPATCVFTLGHVRALGLEGFLVTKDDAFLYDAAFYDAGVSVTPPRAHPLYRRKKARPTRRLPGLCLSLATDYAAGSFGHLLLDGVSRLRLLARAGFDPAAADWILCPHVRSSSTDAICHRLGVAPDRVLNCHPGHDWEFEQLAGTSYPSSIGTVTPETARFLRDFGQCWRTDASAVKRVYLSRRGYRRNLLNQDEIEAVFREFGFLILDTSAGETVFSACANAAILAGVDGSNMTNLAFAPAGARVLIINPPVAPPLPYQTTLACFGDRELHLVSGDPPPPSADSNLDHFTLSPGRLRACLEQICAIAPSPCLPT
jgi:hypothetical protein